MEEIKKILFEGTDAQRKYLFSFTVNTPREDIYKKFQYFTRYFYPKFFKSKDAPFHKEMVMSLISMLRGESDEFLNIGFRGCSKTTFTKLFVAFVIANDTEQSRKYFKVLSEDIKNSKQVVTDVYNLLIQPRVANHYPELFAKTDQKREETMDRFTTSTGIKVISGSIGQEQRGQIQEESRPDFLWFDDIESRNTLRSAVKTRQIWDNMQEAVHGLARGGITTYTCNYISERGNVHLLVERVKNKLIVPLITDEGVPTWDRYTLDEIEAIRDKADDFEGEYLCLEPKTLILTEKGLKEIKTLKVDDLVFTHLGRLKKVLKVFTSSSDNLIDITVNGKVTTITKNHPVLVLRNNLGEWVKAGELKTSDLLVKSSVVNFVYDTN